ncbi:hypothetical protein JCM10296v2_004977 [Rhodotorula toruloides]
MAHKGAPVQPNQHRRLAREEKHHRRTEIRKGSYDKFRLGLLSSFRRSDYENTRELLEGVLQKALTLRWWVHLDREKRRAVWTWMIDLHKAMGKLHEGDLVRVRPAPEPEIQEGSKYAEEQCIANKTLHVLALSIRNSMVLDNHNSATSQDRGPWWSLPKPLTTHNFRQIGRRAARRHGTTKEAWEAGEAF